MRSALIIALGSVLLACSPAQPPRPAETEAEAPAIESGVSIEFMAPSGNLGCVFTPAGGTEVYQTPDGAAELKCDRMEPQFVRIVLPERGAAQIVETQERGCCSGTPLAYGEHWSAGPFQCDMAESGLTCSSADGHGFTLSREEAETH
jgi:hypothetical protein